ncbi:hypothetical protein SB847_20570, partial [Bacillus sp. SIMBA_026]
AWWRLRGELRRRYDFAQHAVHPGYVKVLEQLATEQAAAAALNAADVDCRKRYGVNEMAAFLRALAELEARLASDGELRERIAHLRQAVDPLAALRIDAGAREALDKLTHRIRDNLVMDDDVSLA